MQRNEPNERAGDETDEAPPLKRWSKPSIRPLRILRTRTGSKTGSVDEDNAGSPFDAEASYVPQS